MCENQSGESFLCGLDSGAYNSVTKTGETACRLAWVLFRVGLVSGVWGSPLLLSVAETSHLSFSQPKILTECLPKNSSDNLELDY